MSTPETSTEHEADIVCMICLHEAGSGVFVNLSTVHKLIHVNRNARIWYTEETDKGCTSEIKDQLRVMCELEEAPLMGLQEHQVICTLTAHSL